MTDQIGSHPVITGRWPLDPSLPALIFIHGAAMSKDLWQYQILELADAANTIAVDLPGHGASNVRSFDCVSDYADALLELIREIKAPKTIVCGLSMGGAIVLDLLIRHPKAVSAGICMHTGARLKVLPVIFETIETNFQQYLELAAQFSLGPGSDKDRILPLLSAMTTDDPRVALNDFTACHNFDVMASLAAVTVPTMVITGENDMITPPKYGRFLHDQITGSRLVSIPGAGHLSPIEQSGLVSGSIREFLSDLQPA
jgi:pimeloyl-ACP methyl ester carboxylesterase